MLHSDTTTILTPKTPLTGTLCSRAASKFEHFFGFAAPRYAAQSRVNSTLPRMINRPAVASRRHRSETERRYRLDPNAAFAFDWVSVSSI